MNATEKHEVLTRVYELLDVLRVMAGRHRDELPYEAACFEDAIASLELARKRLRGESTLS